MNRTFLTLTFATQLFVTAAFAQTTDTTTGDTGTMGTGMSFGSDWSPTLGMALFAEDGTTVRSATEIETQWNTLSTEDQDLIRRDCMMYMQSTEAGATDGTGAETTTDATTATTTETDTETGTSTDDTTAMSEDGSTTMMDVSMEQMDQICAATQDL